MQRLSYYLAYPILYLIASLPFWALYKLSDVLYYLLRISGYRKKVVLENLKNSFPEKSAEEIRALCRSYFRYLSDLTLEVLKTMRTTEKEAIEHCVFHPAPWLDKLYEEKKSIIIVLGHYANWEWAGPCFSLHSPYPLNVIYRPLSNPYFEKMMTRMRTKFGTTITPVPLTLREMVANRNKISATAFVADQAAPVNAYWTTFLNQDTSIFNGPEKLARKFNYPVVYVSLRRIRRGFYELTPELLCDNPAATSEGEILEAFARRLEKDILRDPVVWLWSHHRWKHKRSE